MVVSRPNIVSRTVKPSTPDEIELANRVTSEAKAAHPGKSFPAILEAAASNYNIEVCLNSASAGSIPAVAGSIPAVATKAYLGTTTSLLLKEYWLDSSKYASGPLREASARGGGYGHGGGAAGETAGVGGGGARRGSGMVSSKIVPAGAARPGEVFVMPDAEIDRLTNKRVLAATVRSLEGCTCANALKVPELRDMLRQAVRDGKRRRLR